MKEYYGNGPLAVLASQQLEQEKQQKANTKEKIRQAEATVAAADTAAQGLNSLSSGVPFNLPQQSRPEPPPQAQISQSQARAEIVRRARELLGHLQNGDRSVFPELEQYLNAVPELWTCFGDLGGAAIEAWVALIAGSDEIFSKSIHHRLAALRKQLQCGAQDVAAQLLVDRILVTWLQVTYADSRYAQAANASEKVLEFLAKRQRQAQQQHLAALNSWRMWSRLQGVGVPSGPSNPQPGPGKQEPGTDDLTEWVLPFPGGKPAEAV